MVLLSLFVVVVAIDFFSENIGEYPYSDIYVVPFDLNGGMEYPGLIMINKAYFKSSKSTEGALVMGHETAHQWFYGVVGNDQVYSPWLDESLVEYLGFDFLRQYAGSDAADAPRPPASDSAPASINGKEGAERYSSSQKQAWQPASQ